jgi:hypothetical protein
MHFSYFLCPAAADPRPAQREDETDDDHEPDRAMDTDEERDLAVAAGVLPPLDADAANVFSRRSERIVSSTHAL